MNTYDYRNSNEHIDELSRVMDHLSDREAEQALTSIEAARQARLAASKGAFESWFDAAILPILKDYSELTASLLEVEKVAVTHIVVTIRNKYGFDITENCKEMRLALSFAVHIAFNVSEGEAAITLIYDCN